MGSFNEFDFYIELTALEAIGFAKRYDTLGPHLGEGGNPILPAGTPSGYYLISKVNDKLVKQKEFAGLICGGALSVRFRKPLPEPEPRLQLRVQTRTIDVVGDGLPDGCEFQRTTKMSVIGVVQGVGPVNYADIDLLSYHRNVEAPVEEPDDEPLSFDP